MNYLQTLLKKTGYVNIIESLIFIVIGIVLMWKPEETLVVISYILGGIFCVIGALKIVNYVQSKGKNDLFNYHLVYGVMAIIIGIITIVYSGTILNIFRIIIGIWIIYSALVRGSSAIKLRNLESRLWICSLVLAMAMLICGIYIIANSGAIIFTIGVAILVYAIIDLAENILFLQNTKNMF
ncbi:MAG: DUF308 domain-containing protein [Clostridia bacterium]